MSKPAVLSENPDARILSPKETAERLLVTPATLRVWRCTNRYPLNYVKLGYRIGYRPADVQAFIDSRVVQGDREKGELKLYRAEERKRTAKRLREGQEREAARKAKGIKNRRKAA